MSLRKKYYSDEAWAEMAGLTRETSEQTAAEWYQLFLEIGAALDEDVGGRRAQALVARWWRLDPAGEKAEALVARWRELAARSTGVDYAMQRQIALFNLVWEFIAKATYYRMKMYDSLYWDVEASFGEDPGSAKGRALAARWAELLPADAGIDANSKAVFMNACPTLRGHVAFEDVAKFIDTAAAGDKG